MSDKHEAFRVGDRVKLTPLGLKSLAGYYRSSVARYDEALRATVVGLSRNPDCIRVRRDGLKGIETVHKSFWTGDQ